MNASGIKTKKKCKGANFNKCYSCRLQTTIRLKLYWVVSNSISFSKTSNFCNRAGTRTHSLMLWERRWLRCSMNCLKMPLSNHIKLARKTIKTMLLIRRTFRYSNISSSSSQPSRTPNSHKSKSKTRRLLIPVWSKTRPKPRKSSWNSTVSNAWMDFFAKYRSNPTITSNHPLRQTRTERDCHRSSWLWIA